MDTVVIGLTDEETARAGVLWAMHRARSRPANIRLIAELDDGGSNPGEAKAVLASASQRISDALPETQVEFKLADRSLLHELLEQSETADLLVLGSHPDPIMRDGSTPSLPVSLGARSRCPVVVVPDDWQEHAGAIVVGLEAEGKADAALAYAAREAAAEGVPLRIVHTWEPWNTLSTRAQQVEHEQATQAAAAQVRAEHPSLAVTAEVVEAMAHEGIISHSRDAQLIVLGTHGLGRETGVVLGSIHQEVMIRGAVPLCIVPLEDR